MFMQAYDYFPVNIFNNNKINNNTIITYSLQTSAIRFYSYMFHNKDSLSTLKLKL